MGAIPHDNQVAYLLDVTIGDLLKAKDNAKKRIRGKALDLIDDLSDAGHTDDEISAYLEIPASAVRDYKTFH